MDHPPVGLPHGSARRGSGGVGATLWAALIVISIFVVASVVYLGVTSSDFSDSPATQRDEREDVQTPGQPPSQSPGEATSGKTVRAPAFALWAPGTKIQSTDHYPQAGEAFTAQSCTVAFSFSDTDGRNYAVTAGHCGSEGHLVWPTTASTAADYASEAGRFIYSGLFNDGTELVDIGIIEITDPDRYMDLVGDPIPTALYGGQMGPQDQICKTGGTTGYTCGEFKARGRVQLIRTDNNAERETYGDIGNLCALPGDSGGPVFYEIDGRATIIGIVSGTEAGRAEEPCSSPDSATKMMSYSNYDQLTGVIERIVPNAQWVEQVW